MRRLVLRVPRRQNKRRRGARGAGTCMKQQQHKEEVSDAGGAVLIATAVGK